MMDRRATILTAALMAAVLAGTAGAEDWSRIRDDSGGDFGASRAICATVIDRRAPAADRPAAGQAAALKGCDAEALYYGEHGPADPVRARLCAFSQAGGDGETDTDQVFAGRTVLMMLYANGLGVRRNLDLAIHYACNIDGAPMESDGRVAHLAALRAGEPGKARFDFCDDITSGLAQGYCAARDQALAEAGRSRRLDALAEKAAPAARAAFAVLRRAADAFAEAHGSGEVDMSGTARGAMAIEAQEAARDQFADLLERLMQNRLPPATPARARAADDALNAAWKRLTARGERVQAFGTIALSEVRAAQRAWLKYRDAFSAFARAQGLSEDSLVAALTARRTAELEDLTSD